MRISDWSADVCSSDLLDLRIYRAAARAALETGVPVFPHLAVDVEPAIEVFHEEGLPLHRDRKRVVLGKSVSVRLDLVGRSIIKKKIIDHSGRSYMNIDNIHS